MDVLCPSNRSPARVFPSFANTGLEQCEAIMRGICGKDVELQYNGQKSEVSAHMSPARFGRVLVTQWTCSGLTVTQTHKKRFQILFPNAGGFACRTGEREFIWNGRPFAKVNRPGVISTTSVDKASGLCLCVPCDALIECAERLTGKACSQRLFDETVDEIDLESHLGGGLFKTAQTAINEYLKLHATGLEGLILSGYEEMLLNLATCALFPNIAEEAGHTPQRCGPHAISQVRDYIQAHSAETIELASVANRFGMSLRAMQENFRRYYHCSPRDFLLDCRLENAHRALLSSDRALAALDVAARCGFSDYKYFSAKYRDRFLESPSATLRAAGR
jgi:AraC-like DNA-binding protein